MSTKKQTIEAILKFKLFENMIIKLSEEMRKLEVSVFTDLMIKGYITQENTLEFLTLIKVFKERKIFTMEDYVTNELGDRMIIASEFYKLQEEFLGELLNDGKGEA